MAQSNISETLEINAKFYATIGTDSKGRPMAPELVKISTCLYNMDLPLWYGEWDGKFYYENDIEQ